MDVVVKSLGLDYGSEYPLSLVPLLRNLSLDVHVRVARFTHDRLVSGTSRKLVALGHSIGGLLLGMCKWESLQLLDGAVMVATQNGPLAAWPMPWKILMSLVHYVFIPVTCTLWGYMPSALLGFGQSYPKGRRLSFPTFTSPPTSSSFSPPANFTYTSE